jgi:hypothetical protein
MEAVMINLQARRSKFRYEHLVSVDPANPAKRKVVVFEVYYLKSTSGAKGIRFGISPLEIEQCEGHTCESFMLYNQANIGGWAKMLPRKNDKAVLELAERIDSKVPLVVAAYLESVENGKAALAQLIQEIQS